MARVVKMNLDDIGGSFEPIPEGDYEAFVFDVKPTTFKSGNNGFAVTYNIAEGEHKGRKVFDNIVLTENAMWKLGQFWRAVTGDTGEVEINLDDIPAMVGRRVGLSVEIDEQMYQGKLQRRNNVRNMNFLGGAVPAGDDLTSMLEGRGDVSSADNASPF